MSSKTAIVAILMLLQLASAPAQAIDLMTGQVWRYQTRPGEEASRLYLARIDRGLGSRAIYHVYIDGLQLRNPKIEGGVQDHLVHMPLSREAIEASVVELLESEAEMPDISEGYALWLLSFERGQAGIFTIPVYQALQHIENAFTAAN
ncbi:MAG: hypothetical protein ACFCUW_05745 [Kiloniellaceae bacterium]